MSRIKNFVAFATISIIFASCNPQQNNSDSKILTIDIEKHYIGKEREMLLSDLVDEINYVKLETNENCFLDQSAWPEFISENYILIRQYRPPRILLFSRSGKYLHNIGIYGNGPGEFSNILNPVISPDEKYILFNDSSKGLLLYNIDGSFAGKIDQRENRFKNFGFSIEGHIVGFKERTELPASGGYQVLFFDNNLSIIDSLIFSPFDGRPPVMFTWDQMMVNNGVFYYQNRLNDTIFKINEDKTISPEVILKLGRFKIPGHNTIQPKIYDYFDVNNFTSTPNYYLLSFFNDPKYKKPPRVGRAFFVFNKNTQTGSFLKKHEIKTPGGIEESGMPTNNLDGLPDPPIFYTKSLNYDPNQIICLDKLEISTLKEYQEEGFLNSDHLISNNYSERLQVILDQSNIEDNPIIRICYLK